MDKSITKYLITLFLFFPVILLAENVDCRIEPTDKYSDGKYSVGDTVRFKIKISDSDTKYTGFRYYLTLDSDYLEPVLNGKGNPFTPAWFLSDDKSSIVENHLHGDEIGSPGANDISGYQMNYLQQSNASDNGERPYVTGSGTVAYFKLAIKGVPDDAEKIIEFDSNNFTSRVTGYYNKENPGATQEYSRLHIFDFTLVGVYISPEIKDTLITPGESVNKDLKNYSNGSESLNRYWTHQVLKGNSIGDMNIDDQNMLTFNSSTDGHGTYKTKLNLEVQNEDYSDSQKWNIRVDHPPEFVSSLPDIKFTEGNSYTIDRKEIVTDQDDPAENLSIYAENSHIDISYDSGKDSIIFSADSVMKEEITIFAKDTLIFSPVKDTISVNVEPVKPPVFGDLPDIYMHTDSVKNFDLSSYLTDVNTDIEDISVNSTIYNEDGDIESKVTTDYESNNQILTIDVSDEHHGFIMDGKIKLEATDDNNNTTVDSTGFVIVKKTPKIKDLPSVRIKPDTTVEVYNLADYVFDINDKPSDIQWNLINNTSFEYLNYADITDGSILELTSGSEVGSDSIRVVAENSNSQSDTAAVGVSVATGDNSAPEWNLDKENKVVYLTHNNPKRKLDIILSDKVTDDLTSSQDLKYGAEHSDEIKSVIIDSDTRKPIIELDQNIASSQDEGWIKYTATDEEGAEGVSGTVTVKILETSKPLWEPLPDPIRLDVDEVYTLDLYDYCYDVDTDDEQDLTFKINNYYEDKMSFDIDQSGTLTINPMNGADGLYSLDITAIDNQDQTSSTTTELNIIDTKSPDINMNYFINPIAHKRVKFVFTTDENASVKNNEFLKAGSSISTINFEKQSNNVWSSSYKFREEGNYEMIINVVDKNYNEAFDTLNMVAEFPTNTSGNINIQNSNIFIEYPEHNYNEEDIILLSTNTRWNDSEEKHLNKTSNKGSRSKIYQLKNNFVDNDRKYKVYYRKKSNIDKFHSFYVYKDGKKIRKKTYLVGNKFKSFIKSGTKFQFSKSNVAAEKTNIPENGFLAYPNPFNSTINLKFIMESSGPVDLQVYNLVGKKVYEKSKNMEAGVRKFKWHGINNNGSSLASGVYFLLLRRNNKKIKKKKVTIVK